MEANIYLMDNFDWILLYYPTYRAADMKRPITHVLAAEVIGREINNINTLKHDPNPVD